MNIFFFPRFISMVMYRKGRYKPDDQKRSWSGEGTVVTGASNRRRLQDLVLQKCQVTPRVWLFKWDFPATNKQRCAASALKLLTTCLELLNVFMGLELSPRGDGVEERAAVTQGFISSHGLPWLGEGCITFVTGFAVRRDNSYLRELAFVGSNNVFYYTIW